MKKILACMLAILLSSCMATVNVRDSAKAEAKEEAAITQAMYSVVMVTVETVNGKGALAGSGWAVSDDTILTAAHVCEATIEYQARGLLKDDIQISFLNGANGLYTRHNAEIVDMDGVHDICLLYLKDHGLKPLKFAKAGSVEFMDKIWVLGFPRGIMIAATEGRVSIVDSKYTMKPLILRNKMFVTAAAAGGNSGGPVINERGEVVGMLVAGDGSGYDHLSICVPLTRLIRFIELL